MLRRSGNDKPQIVRAVRVVRVWPVVKSVTREAEDRCCIDLVVKRKLRDLRCGSEARNFADVSPPWMPSRCRTTRRSSQIGMLCAKRPTRPKRLPGLRARSLSHRVC